MPTIFTLEKLYSAYNECKKGKKNTHNALAFEVDREKNLLKLLHDLQTRQYKISRYIYFIATYPTAREIFAADFRDRIVHHLLYREIYAIFDDGFIADSYANRVGKGTHGAVKKLQKNMREAQNNNGWSLRNFIPTINDFLQTKLELCLHPRKIILQETRKGVDFLGYFIKPTHTLVRQSVVKRFKNKLYQHTDQEGFLPVSDIPMIQSYLGHFGHANSWNLRKKIFGIKLFML